MSSPGYICILFEVGIGNLVGGYMLGLGSVICCFLVILTLVSGLGFRKIEVKVHPVLSDNLPNLS